GKFSSPEFRKPDRVIPAVGTRIGTPAIQRWNDLYFDLYLPSGTGPWPVVIYGAGANGAKGNAAGAVANRLAAPGLAPIAIKALANGGGPNGQITVTPKAGFGAAVTFPNGGRSVDADGNG